MKPYFEFKIIGLLFSVPAYSFFASVGLFLMMLMIYHRIAVLPRMNFKCYLILMAFIVAGAGAGSKLLFIITKIPDIVANYSFQYLLNTIITAGFVFYGGLIGAIIGAWAFAAVFRYERITITNIVAPAFPLFHAVGRIGCFFGGCCYGIPASWGMAMAFDKDTPRVPIQLFESMFLAIITILLLCIERGKKSQINLMMIYLAMYAPGRFVLEFFRGDIIRGIWYGVSTSQIISLLLLLYLIWKNIYFFITHFSNRERALKNL